VRRYSKCIWNATGHAGFVRGVSLTAEGDGILSVGDDRCVRLWKLDYDMQRWTNPVDNEVRARPTWHARDVPGAPS